VTIGTNEPEADSAIVAIRENNKPEEIRVLVHQGEQQEEPTVLTEPSVWCEVRLIPAQQEWKCHCGHHTGSGRDMDSAIVAIHQEQQ
jgi:hypothetical protein